MGRLYFSKVFLVSVLLAFSFPHGFGRQQMETVEVQDSTVVHIQEPGAEPREMIELLDYKEPGPNTNPKAGFLLSPPPQG